MNNEVVHLHNHSRYSLLDGHSDIAEMIKRAKELGLEAIALTEHGNMFSNIKFYQECKKQGIKPILGSELYMVEDCDEAREEKQRHAHHLVVLAENLDGWHNLCRLTTLANQNYYYKPRIDLKMLDQHKDGLIVLTACMHGPVSYWLFDKMKNQINEKGEEESLLKEAADIPKAYYFAKKLKAILGEKLYLEVQDGGIPEQKIINKRVREIAQKLGVPTIATRDAHYVYAEDAEAHTFLKAIAYGVKTVEQGSHGFSTQEFYLTNRDQMLKTDLLPEEIDRTVEVGKLCNVELDLGRIRLPQYPHQSDKSSTDLLKNAINMGWKNKKIKDPKKIYQERLHKEVDEIEKAGLADYFLIVADIVDYARSQNIVVGTGRGSVGGSLVAYLIGITNVDPLKYGLIWERFYNSGRLGAMPDIDTDVERDRREEVIEYIRNKFGEDRVAQIITLGSLAAKAVLKDVFRAAGIDFDTSNKITSLVPLKNEEHVPISLPEAIAMNSLLSEFANNEDKFDIIKDGRVIRTTSYKELFNIALKLEGCYRNVGKHAAAVIISDKPFGDAGIPLVKPAGNDKNLICGWDLDAIDAIGLLKIDILGLTTLSVIRQTIELVKQRHGVEINIDSLPQNDTKTYELIAQGNTEGVFQLDSSLGKTWSRKLGPRNIDEIAELVAVMRPGVLECGMADEYSEVKSGKQTPNYLHPLLKPILRPTKGVLIFQEQVMEICKNIAGMSLQEADVVRKACGKKKHDLMREQKEKFVRGAIKNVSKELAEKIWGWIEGHAGYSFNRSHAVAYGLIAYQTAWLKANYYTEFLCANLIFAKDRANQIRSPQEVISSFVNDAKLHNVSVLPPRLSGGQEDFVIVDNNKISFGIAHIKNVGASAHGKIQKLEKTSTFDEFLAAAKKAKLNKQVIEALICSGVLDHLKHTRRHMLNLFGLVEALTAKEYQLFQTSSPLPLVAFLSLISSEDALEANKKAFGKMPNKTRRAKLRILLEQYDKKDFNDTPLQILEWEKQYLGISISGDLSDLKAEITTSHSCLDIAQHKVPTDQRVTLCVSINDIREVTVKRGPNAGSPMAFLRVSDSSYALDDVVLFSRAYAKYRDFMEPNDVVLLKGKISDRGGVIVNQIQRV